jgi:uncharacterized LabA/DUF88 family protein
MLHSVLCAQAAAQKQKPQPPKKPEVFAYVDSQNLNLGIQKAGWKLSWAKFYDVLIKKYGVTRAYLFIGYIAENEQMYENLHAIGFKVVLKPSIEMVLTPEQKVERDVALAKRAETAKTDDKEDYVPGQKGNIDAELVMQIMLDKPDYDKAIIVSGDGDFYCVADHLQSIGKLAHVMVPNWQYSSLLKPFEPSIIRLDQLKKELIYRTSRKIVKK